MALFSNTARKLQQKLLLLATVGLAPTLLDFSACAGPCCSRFGKTGDCGVGYFQMVFFRFVPMNMDSWSSQE
jgi:hypothetical protein